MGGWVVGWWSDKTKVILNSTQFKLVEVGVELGKTDVQLLCNFCKEPVLVFATFPIF